MSPAAFLFARDDTTVDQPAIVGEGISQQRKNIYIGGFVAVGVVVLALVGYYGYRAWLRRRPDARRQRTALKIKGIVAGEDEKADSTDDSMMSDAKAGGMFSRDQINSMIVLPEKSVPSAKDKTEFMNERIRQEHRASGMYTRPFSIHQAVPRNARSSYSPSPRASISSRPGSYMPPMPNSANGLLTPGAEGPWGADDGLSIPPSPSYARGSFIKAPDASYAGSGRESVYSMSSSYNASGAKPITADRKTADARRVKNTFDPALPDELALPTLGEKIIILHSFNDGWCVVGRELESAADVAAKAQRKSIFGGPKPADVESGTTQRAGAGPGASGIDDLAVGVVPAWCFVKIAQGTHAERPVRKASLNITLNMQVTGAAGRTRLLSWSNQ